jgi:thiamine biosynthesis lipoprotein
MRARRGLLLLVAASWLLASPARPSVSPHSPAAPLVRYEGTRLSMACVYAIVVYGDDGAALPRIVEEAFDEVDRIDRLMSHYKPESPLSRLNRDAGSRADLPPVDPELFAMIAESLRYSRESDGAFDITVGPLMKVWGFFQGDGRVPSARELHDVKGRVGYAHVILDANAGTIRFDQPGVELDLGGIAKGYAVDRVVALLRARHIVAALVSAGGSTIYALGTPPGEDGWSVSIQDPLHAQQTALTLRLKDRSLSVAGRSEKSFERNGVIYSHIMDPRTARPVQGMLSVAVLSATGTEGDALDDAFFVQGVEKSRSYLARLPGVEAYFFLPDGHHGWKPVHLANAGAPGRMPVR